MAAIPGNTFPTALNNYPVGASSYTLFNMEHVEEHNALEAKLGIGSSTPSAGTVFRCTTTGTSVWSQVILTTDVTGTLPVANGGTGLTTLTSFVTLTGSQTLTNKTLTAPIISTISNTGTLTLPTSTDTLVGKATTDVLTNKTLSGNTATNLISGSGTLTLNTSGTITVPNATDTLVGKATTDTLTNKTLTSPLYQGTIDYWIAVTGSWTYASASTITVPSGAASIYQKGDKIKWTQTTVKYGVITAVADTLLTIAVNTDYVVTNAAISSIYYSHGENPLGFPDYFNFASTFTWNSTPPSTTTSTIARYKIVGREVRFICKQTNTNAGTTNTQVAITGIGISTAGLANEYNYAATGYVSTVAASGGAPTTQAICSVYNDTAPTIYAFFSSISARSVSITGSYEML